MTALGIPPLRDEDGEPMAEEYPGQAFDALAAVLRFASHQGITELTALQAVEYARLIREGRTDLSGRRLS